MSSSLRTLKRRKDRDSEELPPAEQKLPTGLVLANTRDHPIRGEFLSFPLLGWAGLRERDRTPLVMLVLALMEEPDSSISGTLQLELPLYPDTEATTAAFLERYGWLGSVWERGGENVTTDGVLESQLEALMSSTDPPLKSSFVFPGASHNTQTIDVSRAQGRFLMPPLPAVETPNAEKVEALREAIRRREDFFFEPGEVNGPVQ